MQLTWIGSPNYDTNRTPVDEIFIHWIVGTLASADAQFQKANGTSAHYGIEDDQVHQYVKEEHVAYHAGVYSHNQRSIGIEHSADQNRPASEQTYQTSGKLIAEICKRHSIPLDREHIRGHKEVRATQCPGTMDIDKLIRIAKENSTDPLQECLTQHTQLVNELEDVKKTIAGHKSRATTMEQERDSARGELAVEKEKHKQTKDQLAVKETEYYAERETLLARIDELSKGVPDMDLIRAEYETQLGVLRDSQDKLQKKLNDANIQIAKLNQPVKDLPFWEKVKILFA